MKVGINGFGRIGRLIVRGWAMNKDQYDFDIVAVNDIGDPKTMEHLFKYDSTFGIFCGDVKLEGDSMVVNGKKIKIISEKDPKKLPWKELGVDYVIESTGLFTKAEDAKAHLEAGAKKVIISAPAKGEGVKTIVLGVNEKDYDPDKDNILSNASCTTNCLAPVVKVLHENFKIVNGLMTTIHAYTNDQRILDLPHKDLRRARSAALSMIPTTTGAAKAIGLVMPELKGKIDGISIRVPTPDVSIVDFVCNVEKDTTAEQVNNALKAASAKMDGPYLYVCDEPLVSIDFRGNKYSSIVDSPSTAVIGGKMIKVMSWYDNEWGYAQRVNDLVAYMMKKATAKV